MTVALHQRPAFKRAYKKLHANQRDAVHAAMRALIADPMLGEEKKGDLAGVWVYKFDCIHQLHLLAYLWDASSRTWLAVGDRKSVV